MTYLGTQVFAQMRCIYANLASKGCHDRDKLIKVFLEMAEELKKDEPKARWERSDAE